MQVDILKKVTADESIQELALFNAVLGPFLQEFFLEEADWVQAQLLSHVD